MTIPRKEIVNARRQQNLTAGPQPSVVSVLFAKSVRGPFRVTAPAFDLQPGNLTKNSDRKSAQRSFDPEPYLAP